MSSPTFPKSNSLNGRALMRLLTGKKFTHRDFQNETASYRLSSFIEQLRNRHRWPIDSIEETAPTRDPVGRNATYVRYSLSREFVSSMGHEMKARIQKFVDAVRHFEDKEEL